MQTNVSSRRGVRQQSVSFWHRLMGADGTLDQSIKSPYTSRILKPFIRSGAPAALSHLSSRSECAYCGISTPVCLICRRDYESRPVKLRLLEEIRAHPHRREPDWVPEPNAPIDYCYVRPNHIPSVNAMCHDSFWPGKHMQ